MPTWLKPKDQRLVYGRYLDISTGHMSLADRQLLETTQQPLTAYKYREGFWVHVSPNVTGRYLRRWGFGRGFAKVYLAAKRAKCWFVRFDCDGTRYRQFPRYHW